MRWIRFNWHLSRKWRWVGMWYGGWAWSIDAGHRGLCKALSILLHTLSMKSVASQGYKVMSSGSQRSLRANPAVTKGQPAGFGSQCKLRLWRGIRWLSLRGQLSGNLQLFPPKFRLDCMVLSHFSPVNLNPFYKIGKLKNSGFFYSWYFISFTKYIGEKLFSQTRTYDLGCVCT